MGAAKRSCLLAVCLLTLRACRALDPLDAVGQYMPLGRSESCNFPISLQSGPEGDAMEQDASTLVVNRTEVCESAMNLMWFTDEDLLSEEGDLPGAVQSVVDTIKGNPAADIVIEGVRDRSEDGFLVLADLVQRACGPDFSFPAGTLSIVLRPTEDINFLQFVLQTGEQHLVLLQPNFDAGGSLKYIDSSSRQVGIPFAVCAFRMASSEPIDRSTASPGPDEGAGDDGGDPCFPFDAVVELENGSVITMEQLRIGDRIRVSAQEYSQVLMFGHRDARKKASFLEFEVEGGFTLQVSANHYIYGNGKLVIADSVQEGDLLMTRLGSFSVTRRGRVVRSGLFSPVTSHGDLIVNGIFVSSYTSAIQPWLVRILLVPVRAFQNLGAGKLLSAWMQTESKSYLARGLKLARGPTSIS